MNDPVEAALDAWFRNPEWRKRFKDVDPECADAMRRALAAAYEVESISLLATDEFQSCIKQYLLKRAAELREER